MSRSGIAAPLAKLPGMSHDRYENPLLTRYASDAMAEVWSARTKHGLWRRLWLALAESQQQLGLDIPDAALEQMRGSLDLSDDDFALAAKYEKDLRHDVMAHVHAWGDVCPDARPIIHLGATSCFVTDNAELDPDPPGTGTRPRPARPRDRRPRRFCGRMGG